VYRIAGLFLLFKFNDLHTIKVVVSSSIPR